MCYHFPFVLCCGSGTGGGGGIGGGGGLIDGDFDDHNRVGSGTPSEYRILPNPASDKLLVVAHDVNPAKQRELRLLDHTGRLVSTVRLTAEAEVIDIAAYPPGVYIAVVLENGLPVKVEKVAIVR